MASDQEKRKLSELRVVDLRSELEKRGIDKMGVKAVLTDRLIKALEEEGHNPESYVFEPLPKVTPKRPSAKARDMDTESESLSNADETHDLSLDVDEEMRDDLSNKTEDIQAESSQLKLDESKDLKSDADTIPRLDTANTIVIKVEKAEDLAKESVEALKKEESKESVEVPSIKSEDGKPDDGTNAVQVKIEQPSPVKAVPAAKPKPILVKPAEVEKPVPDANGIIDNEDSINLDIGEDEEKLLADEDDSCSQEKDHKVAAAHFRRGTSVASDPPATRFPVSEDNCSLIVSVDEGGRAGKNQDNGREVKKEGAKDEDRKQSASDEKAGKTQEELKDDKAKSSADQKSKDDKDKAKKTSSGTSSSSGSSSRNLWVSGLSSATRATDLKQVFSKYGKVIGAKVVTNARTPGARCYGYVTMATGEEAAKCIQYLHRTELHGRMISVEKAKGESGPPRRGETKTTAAVEKKRSERKPITMGKPNGKAEEKKKEADEGKKDEAAAKTEKTVAEKATVEKATEDGVKEKSPEDAAKAKEAADKEAEAEKEKRSRELSRERKEKRRIVITRSRSPHRPPRPPLKGGGSPSRKPARPLTSLLTFSQIREERERNRARERERDLREEERRGRIVIERQKEAQREIQRKQREEAIRLDREKEKLRLEREKIEMERAELLRMERDRQRLERERLEREREELKRQQLRFEEARRTIKRPAEDRRDPYPEERKRVPTERRFEPPPPARFEESRGNSSNDFPIKKDVRRGSVEFPPPPRRSDPPPKFVRSSFAPSEARPSSRREPSPPEMPPSRREHAPPPMARGSSGGSGKDNRFERGGASSFRERDDRRPDSSDHRAKVDPRQSSRDHRYQDSAKSGFSSSKGEGRYTDRAGSTWHAGSAGPPPIKSFSSTLSSAVMAPRDSWPPAERKSDSQSWSRPMESGWSSSGGPILSRSGPTLSSSSLYSSSSQNMPPSMSGLGMSGSGGGPYSSDRFDSYKQPMSSLRKY